MINTTTPGKGGSTDEAEEPTPYGREEEYGGEDKYYAGYEYGDENEYSEHSDEEEYRGEDKYYGGYEYGDEKEYSDEEQYVGKQEYDREERSEDISNPTVNEHYLRTPKEKGNLVDLNNNLGITDSIFEAFKKVPNEVKLSIFKEFQSQFISALHELLNDGIIDSVTNKDLYQLQKFDRIVMYAMKILISGGISMRQLNKS